ncbi:MAG: DUF503 domain-containing protein [Firmicutes bacterium]|nr:DUF503 domain-containing protein [Bacillota bacterium]
MVIGTAIVDLYIPGSNSLKDKRRVVRSILDRIRSRYNVSAAEISNQDEWRQLTLGFAWVSNEGGHVCRSLQGVIRFLERLPDVEVIDYSVQVI